MNYQGQPDSSGQQPNPGQQPYPGQPYPGQQPYQGQPYPGPQPPPGYGPPYGQQPYGPPPPFGPPPKRRARWPWLVVPLVVVLVAGAVVAVILLSGKGSQSGASGGGGGGCTGDYCVAGYQYLNACQLLPPSEYPGLFGDMGSGVRIDETYADPLPRVSGDDLPSWTFGAESSCDTFAEGGSDTVEVRHVLVRVRQAAQPATPDNTGPDKTPGHPLTGGPAGALKFDLDGAGEAHLLRGNAQITLEMEWGRKGTPVPDAAFAKALTEIDTNAGHATGEPAKLATITRGGTRIVVDACTVFTAEDFQKTTGFVADPTDVNRTYTNPPDGAGGVECTRNAASSSDELPQPPGTTFLDDGGFGPDVTVTELDSPAAAKSKLAEDKAEINKVVAVTGVGDGAVFGIGSSTAYRLEFVKGFQVVRIDLVSTVGTADWTPEKVQSKLAPLAKAIAARM